MLFYLLGFEFVRKLLDDPHAQPVGHVQDLLMHLVIGFNISGPIAVQPRDNFIVVKFK